MEINHIYNIHFLFLFLPKKKKKKKKKKKRKPKNSQNSFSKYKKLKINTSKVYSPQFPPILALKIQCITL